MDSVKSLNLKGKVIVVDDEPHQCKIMSEVIGSLGYEVISVNSPIQALQKISEEPFDLLITDLQMPEMSGVELLANVKEQNPTLSVVVVTAHGTIDSAVDAMKKGAEDYLQKPIEFDSLEIILKRVFEKRQLITQNLRLTSENAQLRKELGLKYHIANAIGISSAAQLLMKKIEKYSSTNDIVLITGESGTGKTDVARMIHYNSSRAANAILYFDCATVPEDLQEIHLFGEEERMQDGVKVNGHPGLVEKSHLGTLVLINVHLLDRKCQSRLTLVLQGKKNQRVGGQKFYQTDIRLLATTNIKNFNTWINSRPDLTNLLSQNLIELTPLRERKEDIPLLALASAKRVARNLGRNIDKLAPDILEYIIKQNLSGNHDELELLMEKAVANCLAPILKLEHLESAFKGKI